MGENWEEWNELNEFLNVSPCVFTSTGGMRLTENSNDDDDDEFTDCQTKSRAIYFNSFN